MCVSAQGCLCQASLALSNHSLYLQYAYIFDMTSNWSDWILDLNTLRSAVKLLFFREITALSPPFQSQPAGQCCHDTFGQWSTLSTQPGGEEAAVQQHCLQLSQGWEPPYVSSLQSLSQPGTAEPLGLSHICVLILLSTRSSGGEKCAVIQRVFTKWTTEKWTQGGSQGGGIPQGFTPSLVR